METKKLANTSVDSMKAALECALLSNPATAAHQALAVLDHLQGREGHSSRRKVAAAVLRKAASEMAKG